MLIFTIFLLAMSQKLAPNIFDKEKYVLHYDILQRYVKLGLKLTKIHPVLEFKQLQWLKPHNECRSTKNTRRKR